MEKSMHMCTNKDKYYTRRLIEALSEIALSWKESHMLVNSKMMSCSVFIQQNATRL